MTAASTTTATPTPAAAAAAAAAAAPVSRLLASAPANILPQHRRFFADFEQTTDDATDARRAVNLVRATLAPEFRRTMYVWLRNGPLPAFSNTRLFHAIARGDEKIEAMQISACDLVPRAPPATAAATGDNKQHDDASAATSAGATAATAAATPLGATATATSHDVPAAAAQQRLDALARDFDIRVTVQMLVQVPSARYCHNFDFFRTRMRSTGVADHFGGKPEAGEMAADTTARILAVSKVFSIFRALDWVSRKTIKLPTKLDPRALPLHMMGLSEAFPTQPARYVKSFTFAYCPEVRHWRVAEMSTLGHYMRDFDPATWRAENGGTP